MEKQNLENKEDWIEIGKIVAPQGLKGELRVNSNSDFPERFKQPGERWLQYNQQSDPQSIQLLGGYQIPGKNIYVIKLEGISDRNQAETLRGCKLLVKNSDHFVLDEDEYHVKDLINLEVINQLNGENIGVVIDLFTAGNNLLEVKLHQQKLPEIKEESSLDISKINRVSKIKKIKAKKHKKAKQATVLIPFVKEIVPIVNLEKGIIEINPPLGLLDNKK
jgi:16S rRNA processing protein RimM